MLKSFKLKNINVVGYDKYNENDHFENVLKADIIFLCLPTLFDEVTQAQAQVRVRVEAQVRAQAQVEAQVRAQAQVEAQVRAQVDAPAQAEVQNPL
jgi:hypothetical protein